MMKNRTLILVILFSIFFLKNTIAQENKDISVEFGDVFKNDEREIPVKIVGKDENGFYLLYSEGRFGQGDDMRLRKFGLDLLPTDQELSLKRNDVEGDFNSLGVSKIKDKIIHLYFVYTETGKQYFYQSVDLENFSLGETKFITEIKNDTRKAINSVSRFMVSEDDESIILFYTIPNKNKEFQKIRIHIFDTDFNEKSSEEFEFKYENKILVINYILEHNNEIFLLCKKYNSSKIMKEEQSQGYVHLIYRINGKTIDLISTIKPEGVNLRSLKPNINDENQLILTGLYSNNDMYAMTGIYNSKIDLSTGEILFSVYNKFDPSFITKLMKEGKKKDKTMQKFKDGKYEDPYYVLKTVILQDNNEILAIAEQTRTYTYNYVTTYYHQNISIIKLNEEGDLVWVNKIGKNNTKSNVSIYNSYYPIYKNNNLYLLYNCSLLNLDHKVGKVANTFGMASNRVFIATKVDSTGKYNRTVLCNNEALKTIIIRPRLYNWIDENSLLMFGQDIDNLKNQRFIKFTFQE